MTVHPSGVKLLDGSGQVRGNDGVDYLEELTLAGPGGTIPYIRVHYTPDYGGGYADFPKHNLQAVWYTPTPSTAPTTP